MKAKFLKLAGVKNEDAFYKKFPTEEAFMAKYGKQLKKAAPGIKAPAMPKIDMVNLANTKGFGLTKPDKAPTAASNTAKASNKGLFGNITDSFKNLDSKGAKDLGMSLATSLGGIMGGFEQIEDQKKQLAELKKYGQVSDVVAQASKTRPEQVKQKYVRPEEYLTTPTYALGRQGDMFLAENGTEIQNTYAPDVIYTDLGYEPLNDSNVKQYKKGGKLKKAASGVSQILGGIGSAAAAIPGIGTAAQIGLPLLGTAYDMLFPDNTAKEIEAANKKLKDNVDTATGIAGVMSAQAQNKAFMEDGGWVSNDWQPQVIASFGDYSMKDLLKPDPMMDTLRAGGHLKQYTPPSERAMYTGRDLPYQMEDGGQMAMDGDLQVYRGSAETLSYNPFLPNGGETVMFRGPSHDDGGMPISYGQNGVEVEGGEPAQVMKDGGKQDNLVVFGNMRIPDYGANEIGDKKSKGMKFKRYIADLSKTEAKNNKTMDKSFDLINSSNTDDPFDQLSFNSGQAMLMGSQMQLKDIADKKLATAAVQNAILDTADEYGLDSAKLADKQMAAFGGKFASNDMFAKGGKKPKSKLITDPSKPVDTLESFVKNIPYAERKSMAKNMGVPNFEGTAEQNQFLLGKTQQSDYAPLNTVKQPGYVTPKSLMSQTAMNKSVAASEFGQRSNVNDTEDSAFDWETIGKTALGSIYPFIMPTAAQPLDPNQIAPELLASSMNQLEPVQAQLFDPMLTQATSISLQDQLNEITSQTRAAERMAPYNPSAASAIFGQAAAAKNKVLGEQFRMNQAEKQRVSEQNSALLNDAKMKNLALLDQQYVRQSEAKSKTKAQSIEIAKSIADKIAQNKLENKQQRVMENMYPAYSFTSSGTAYKNPLYMASFAPGMGRNTSTSASGAIDAGGVRLLPTDYDAQGNPTKYKKVAAKNGAIVKAIKNL